MDLRKISRFLIPLLAVSAIAWSGCRKNAARSEVSDVEVVAVGDTSLMLQEVLRQIPIERVVLETDAPYLSPVPHRGKRNESAYIRHTLVKVAEAVVV